MNKKCLKLYVNIFYFAVMENQAGPSGQTGGSSGGQDDEQQWFIKVNGVERAATITTSELEQTGNTSRHGGRSRNRKGDNTRPKGEKKGSHKKRYYTGFKKNPIRIRDKLCRKYGLEKVRPEEGQARGQHYCTYRIPELGIRATGWDTSRKKAQTAAAKILHHQYCRKLYKK
jgi:hypothetical protein